jgi:hypothetical protein
MKVNSTSFPQLTRRLALPARTRRSGSRTIFCEAGTLKRQTSCCTRLYIRQTHAITKSLPLSYFQNTDNTIQLCQQHAVAKTPSASSTTFRNGARPESTPTISSANTHLQAPWWPFRRSYRKSLCSKSVLLRPCCSRSTIFCCGKS